jgi:hypothetical protein
VGPAIGGGQEFPCFCSDRRRFYLEVAMPDKRLLELAARCEQATGPDRELDGAIAALCFGAEVQRVTIGPDHRREEIVTIDRSSAAPLSRPVTPYTASLDAAMMLVPSAFYWSAGTIAQDGYEHYDDMDFAWAQAVHRRRSDHIDCEYAATPALALCSAALKARANREMGDG